MFTGIIETTGRLEELFTSGSNTSFWISSHISGQLRVDQSVSHNGVCLTVEKVQQGRHLVTAVQETLSKTTLGLWKPGEVINMERCMEMNGRLDGHLVQGHVDTTGACQAVEEVGGSRVYRFSFPEQFAPLIVEKGSICLDGISLTVFDISRTEFSVAIIPFTWEHTNMKAIEAGSRVNLEFDIIGKYILRQSGLFRNIT